MNIRNGRKNKSCILLRRKNRNYFNTIIIQMKTVKPEQPVQVKNGEQAAAIAVALFMICLCAVLSSGTIVERAAGNCKKKK
jgi:hypothetical protein